MTERCKGWNGKAVPPFTPLLWKTPVLHGVSHIPPALDGGYIGDKEKT